MKSITALIVAVALCGTVMCDKNSEWSAEVRKCLEEHSVSIDDLTGVMKGDMEPADVTQNQKCALLCIAESEGTMKGGVLQTHVLSRKIAKMHDKEALEKTIAICKELKGVDNCDTAYKITTCFIKNRTA